MFRPSFFYFDEGATFGQVTHQVADAVAKRRTLIFISHMSPRKVGGWDKWLVCNKRFLDWLKTNGIPVKTPADWTHAIFEEKQDPYVNVFPSLTADRDGDGGPDGCTLEKGATCDLASGTIRLVKDARFSVCNLAGVEKGKVRLAFKAKGAVGTRVTLDFNQSDRWGWFTCGKQSFGLAGGWKEFTSVFDVEAKAQGATILLTSFGDVDIREPSLRAAWPDEK